MFILNSHLPLDQAESNLMFSPSSILKDPWASLSGKFAERREIRGGREGGTNLSLKSFRISHNSSAHFFMEGLDFLKGSRHVWANLSTFSTAMFDAGHLFSLGSMASTTSPSFNFWIACKHEFVYVILSFFDMSYIIILSESLTL